MKANWYNVSNQLFDAWPDRYDRWFETPIGSVVKASEQDLVMEFLSPVTGETILDAGCGTGIFTSDILDSGAHVVGLDLSFPMVARALLKWRSRCFYTNLHSRARPRLRPGTPGGSEEPTQAYSEVRRGKRRRHPLRGYPEGIHMKANWYCPVVGDILRLPFRDETFDKAVSITALEFIDDAKGAVGELFRVTRSKGLVVVATLNSQSPWAERRRKEAVKKQTIFSKAIFRSPWQMLSIAPFHGVVKTAVHFQKESDPEAAIRAEREGRKKGLQTGAFVAVRWQKP